MKPDVHTSDRVYFECAYSNSILIVCSYVYDNFPSQIATRMWGDQHSHGVLWRWWQLILQKQQHANWRIWRSMQQLVSKWHQRAQSLVSLSQIRPLPTHRRCQCQLWAIHQHNPATMGHARMPSSTNTLSSKSWWRDHGPRRAHLQPGS